MEKPLPAARVCPRCGTETSAARCEADGAVTIDRATLGRGQRDSLLGTTIAGRFEIEERLGRGGYGTVYKARHKETGGPVALKVMRPDLVGDERVVRRFYLEAQNTHRLQHPNTVRVVDFGVDADTGGLYFVTELVDGRPLAEVLGQPMVARRALRIIRQVLKSLGEAHERKLIHRDVKPQNIMLTDQFGEPDFVKVLDFGIARSLDDSAHHTVGVVGTPLYMSPEQCLSMPVDPRTDLYSVGCVLYHMLTGQPPVQLAGPGVNAMAVMAAQVQAPAPSLATVAPGCPAALAALVTQLLEKDPERRPASAADVLRALDTLERTAGPALDAPLDVRVPVNEANEATLDPHAPVPFISSTEPTLDRPSAPPDTVDGRSPPPVQGGPTAEVVALVTARRRLWVAVPLVVLLTAAVTWYAATRGPDPAVPSIAPAVALEAPPPEPELQPEAAAPATPAPGAAVPTIETPFQRVTRAADIDDRAPRRDLSPPLPPLTAELRSEPGGAMVTVGETGERVGLTPYSGALPPAVHEALRVGRSVTLVFKLAGHRTRTERVEVQGDGVTAQVTLKPARTGRAPARKPPTGLPVIR